MSSYDAMDVLAARWCLAMLLLIGVLLAVIHMVEAARRRRRRPVLLPAAPECQRSPDWRAQAFHSRFPDPF
jgi:hypothetical protein